MRKIDIVNFMILRDFKIENLKKKTNQLIYQKKMYLLRELGFDLGYNYIWSPRGPYSSELAEYLAYMGSNFDYFNSKINKSIEHKLEDVLLKNILLVNSLGEYKPDTLTLSYWYQLLSSSAYIYNNPIMWNIEKVNYQVIQEILKEFSLKEVKAARDCLVKFNFI